MGKNTLRWWQRASVYQIYPLSFQDSDGDGFGDLPGIISRLDHIKHLGIDVIWLSPVFQSPMKDNGYDVADYRAVNPLFGTKDDLKQLVDAVHQRGIKIITDIVLNHTSDQHHWFLDAVNNMNSPYRDYYIFRKQINDIESLFSGSAWTKVPTREEYYFHFFAKEQPDLNWQNPKLRSELYSILKEWLTFGFDGFRLDVIDLIGKDIDKKIIGHGPFFSEFLKEMGAAVFNDANIFTVGELSGSSPEQAALVTGGPPTGILSTAFQFSHLWLDEQPGKGKWALKKLAIPDLENTFMRLDATFKKRGWNALFMGNHDQPRPVSRYGSSRYRYRSQTMLFLAFHGQRGTPFIYQGEEIGMLNYPFKRIGQFKDIESINYYHANLGKESKRNLIASLKSKGRDNARTPMQWNKQKNSGFTAGIPWLRVHPQYRKINVETDAKARDSIQTFLKEFLAFRKTTDVFTDGDLHYLHFHQDVYSYIRESKNDAILIIASFSRRTITFSFPDFADWIPILTNDKGVELTEKSKIPPFYGGLYRRRTNYGHD